MKSVPKLQPCPRCGLDLEAGGDPSGMAWHGCDPGRKVTQVSAPVSVTSLVERGIADPGLTMQDAGLLYARLVLDRLNKDPGGSTGDPGSVFEGMAKFITSKGEGGGTGWDKLLQALQEAE